MRPSRGVSACLAPDSRAPRKPACSQYTDSAYLALSGPARFEADLEPYARAVQRRGPELLSKDSPSSLLTD